MQEEMAVAFARRLGALEEKLDACLALLRMLTTQDDFSYSFRNRSARFVNGIMASEGIASRAIASVASRHPEHDWAWFSGEGIHDEGKK